MDMAELLKQLQTGRKVGVSDQVRLARNKHERRIRDNVLHITAAPLTPHFKLTMVYAIFCHGYGETEFSTDVQSIARRYDVPENEILRFKVTGSDKVPDEDAAFRDIQQIIEKLNNPPSASASASTSRVPGNLQEEIFAEAESVSPAAELRIVEVGIKKTRLMEDILKHMLQKWEAPSKTVQFVHVDSSKKILKFWQKSCLKGLVNKFEYVNITDYTALGMVE